MDHAATLHTVIGAAIVLLAFGMAVNSIFERRYRAVAVSVLLMDLAALLWFYPLDNHSAFPQILLVLDGIAIAVLLLFFIPIARRAQPQSQIPVSRVDERDTMFAREEYLPGTDKYEAYYSRHPELKDADDGVRSLPELLSPGGRYYDSAGSPYIQGIFDQIKRMTTGVDGPVNPYARQSSSEENTREMREYLKQRGACDVGFAPLNPMYVYSHVGRGPEPYGSEITNKHRYAIVFCVEMSYLEVETAPRLPITIETANKYLVAAEASVALAQHIRSLGYPARAHISDSNYQILLPPVAVDAGLGEIGRLGYLIHPRFGPRIRLGAVTTDLPVVADRPIGFGGTEFCAVCRKCAENCPSGAIPRGDRTKVNGVDKWQLDVVRCIRYWRIIGTDCGICMRVCPFSHPSTLLHNLVRAGIKRSDFARRLAVYGDDLFYGRRYGVPRPDRRAAAQP